MTSRKCVLIIKKDCKGRQGNVYGRVYFVACCFSRQTRCPYRLILLGSKTQQILKKGALCLHFDSLLINFQITVMQKNFPSNMKKQLLREKKKKTTQFAASPGCSPRTSCGSRHFHNNSYDAKVTGDLKNTEEKPQVITNNLLVTSNICFAVIFILFTDNSQRIKTCLKTICWKQSSHPDTYSAIKGPSASDRNSAGFLVSQQTAILEKLHIDRHPGWMIGF